MFNTPPSRTPDRPLDPNRSHEGNTVIARGVKVEGDLASQGNIVIEGEVQGTLQCSGLLTVGSEAKVNANINAQEALVSGTVEGNINVVKRLELKSTAKIIGDIVAEGINIEVGAAISGRLTVGMKGAPASSKNSLPIGKRELKVNLPVEV
jgi:cytoskeletal protein CcmA (bactofilin family)